MMTSVIQTVADIGGISQPDINLPVLLRRGVCPKFMHDVAYVSWRRKIATVANGADLPTDVDIIQGVYNGVPTSANPPLMYVGENPDFLIGAPPSNGYYYKASAAGVPNGAIVYVPSSITTCTLVYYRKFYFADDTTDVDMNLYVPEQYQWALVEGLKAEIYRVRLGLGDPNYIAAETAYKQIVERAHDNKEQARRNLPVLVR